MYKMRLTFGFLIFALFTFSCVDKSSRESSPHTVSENSFSTPDAIIVATATLLPPSTQIAPNALFTDGCIKSFDQFAYTFWNLRDEFGDVQLILPPSPWEIVDAIPYQQIEGYYPPRNVNVILARSIAGVQEIWIAQRQSSRSEPAGKNLFVIYQPISQSWEVVSENIENTEFYVKNLFVTNDGSVWGSTAGKYREGQKVPEYKVPVLSKYNENTRQFEFMPGVLEIALEQPVDPKIVWYPYFAGINIALDNRQNIFWIFSEKDGIYRFNPVTQTTQKWLDSDLRVFFGPVVLPDGSIFVDDFRPEKNIEPYFHLYNGSLLQFFPDTKKLVPLEMPNEPWPWFSGWLVSGSGDLWLGAMGYRKENGSWQLLHPDTQRYFKNIGNLTTSTPYLMLESSDGLLWYQKYLDMGSNHEGTAWYDPRTKEGCMFTNLAVNIIEDSMRQLWLVADGKLYKNSLSNP